MAMTYSKGYSKLQFDSFFHCNDFLLSAKEFSVATSHLFWQVKSEKAINRVDMYMYQGTSFSVKTKIKRNLILIFIIWSKSSILVSSHVPNTIAPALLTCKKRKIVKNMEMFSGSELIDWLI